ncbi:PocR ligand-binding domain-containing protein [Anaerotaenia torta]|uniref:PocR ligand-binding domain-containing protein n=1 Tax=Anaerotaenia torta TaxID=433293 RepID=UPI003D1E4E35
MKSYIYTIVEKEKLREVLVSFSVCMELPIQILDERGNMLLSEGEPSAFCNYVTPYLPPSDTCRLVHANAGKKAMELGETYIFSCHCNLNHIVFPLINRETLFGSVLVGPFLMTEPDSELIMELSRRYPALSTGALLDLYEDANRLPVIPPAMVTQISRLLYYLFSSFVSDAKQELIINSKKVHQQSKINESIQMYKTMGLVEKSTYPYEKEKLLLAKVKSGDKHSAAAILNDLLGYVFFSQGNGLDVIKIRAMELCSLLSRSAIDGGAGTNQILKINNDFIKNIEKVKSIDDLCYMLMESLDAYVECMFTRLPAKHNDSVRKAMKYISEHFAEPITLEKVASYVHLNPSYFSSSFKEACGSSFKEYLNMVRVEESKRLLAHTDFPLVSIAISTGFEDQSYFSKVFKKYTGITPKQYRG